MKRVVLSGWNVGFKKVGLTKFLRYDFGYSLSEAKAITDSVLDGKSAALEIPEEYIDELVSKLTDLGVKDITVDGAGHSS